MLAQIHQCQGNPALALAHYMEALALAENRRSELLFPCYDGLATLHLDLDDAERPSATCGSPGPLASANIDPDTLIVLPFLA